MAKALKIRDITLRDGQQSLFSSRLRQETVEEILPLYKGAGFYIVEVWGGNIIDSAMRFLDESPWDRLRTCSRILGDQTLLGALSRGRNLFGYSPYPNYVLESFYKEAVKNGLKVIRLFDSLNDMDNLKDSALMLNELGVIPDIALCYTVDPEEVPLPKPKKKGFFARLFGSSEEVAVPEKIFTDEYFVAKAREIEKCGAKIFTLKDLAGLVSPSRLYSLMPKLKHAVKIPVDYHTHCNAGYGLASTLTAILKGVDIVDTAIWWFAGGTSAPAIELIWLFCKKLGIEVSVDMEKISEIRSKLKEARKSLSDFDRYRDSLPFDFDELYMNMPPEIDAEFDSAIRAASDNCEPELLDACHRIEEYFGFPVNNAGVSNTDVPHGMYSDIKGELWIRNVEEMLDATMALIPKVRRDAGLVPLVSPSSRIIGEQAVMLALDRRDGNPDYTQKSDRFVALIKGEYGHTPKAIDPFFREEITGSIEEIPYDVSTFSEPANPELPEFGGIKLAQNDEEYLLLELMPELAETFLKKCREKDFSNKADFDEKTAL